MSEDLALAQTHVISVDVSKIDTGNRLRPCDQETVDALAKDIAARGLLQPIAVRQGTDGKFDLIYGHHRLEAFRQISKKFPSFDRIPATIWPSSVPDWQVQLAEIAENLCRKELTSSERQEHTLRAAAIYKRQGLVATSQEVASESGKRGGRGNTSQRVGTSCPNPLSKPTVAEKLSTDLGIDKKTAQRRVRTAALSAGMNSVTLESATPEQLNALADTVRDQVKNPAPNVDKPKAIKTVKTDENINPELAKEVLALRKENERLAKENIHLRQNLDKEVEKRFQKYIKENLDSDTRKSLEIARRLNTSQFPLTVAEWRALSKVVHEDTRNHVTKEEFAAASILLNEKRARLCGLAKPTGPERAFKLPPLPDSLADLFEANPQQKDRDRKIRQAAKAASSGPEKAA